MPAHAATDLQQSWTIREIADEFDVTHRTVRHYEDLGLITPERRGTDPRLPPPRPHPPRR